MDGPRYLTASTLLAHGLCALLLVLCACDGERSRESTGASPASPAHPPGVQPDSQMGAASPAQPGSQTGTQPGAGSAAVPGPGAPPPAAPARGAGPPRVAGEPVLFQEQRPEFEAIAASLLDGDNPYLGRRPLTTLRARVEAPGLTAFQQLEASVQLANKLLEQGEEQQAVEQLLGATAQAEQIFGDAAISRLSFLYARLCVAWLREAEVENCIQRNNSESCIFPLRGGGVHVEDKPARRALELLERFTAAQPTNLTARWLLNVAAMAAGEYPLGVPPPALLPPSAFASEHDVGRFEQAAKRLGVDSFSLCGGVVCDDLDGDGWLDLLTSSFDPEQPLVFYRNTGQGGFEDRSAVSRLDDQLGGLNLISADADGDGDVDVFVLRGAWLYEDGRIRNSLLLNDGLGVFTDVTRPAGLAEPPCPTQTAAFGDFDGDGWLDLYVGNESRVSQDPVGDYPSQLFHNQGDGSYRDVAAASGVSNDRYAKGVAAGDYDNDGDLDLYVSNMHVNRLYRNRGDGVFDDVAAEAGVTEPTTRSFATWFFDQDNDGWLDLFVAPFRADPGDLAAQALGQPHHAELPRLYHNRGDGSFDDQTQERGLDRVVLPMGANFGDLDNDGWLDIYLTTGDPSFETLMPDVMLRNERGGRYQDVTVSGGFGHLQKGHGVAFADLDQDGDQDIYHQLGGFYPADAFYNALFLNPGHGRHWLKLELVSDTPNRSAVGARLRVVLRTRRGTRTLHRAVGSVSSFGGTPRRQELGLGKALAVERVEIDWPPPQRGTQVLSGVPLDALIRVTQGRADFERLPLPSERF